MNDVSSPSTALRPAAPVGESTASGLVREALGLSVETFDRTVRGQSFRVGHAPRLRETPLLNWPMLNQLLETAGRRLDLLQLCRDGQVLPQGHYARTRGGDRVGQLAPAAVARALREGYSLILNDLHAYHPPATQVADELTELIGEVVTVTACVSWTKERCFPTRWDEGDVFIIQTHGEMEWSVFAPGRRFPERRDVAVDSDASALTPAWRGVLKPGDVLYMPRGWWHHAHAVGHGSMHLTCGFNSRTSIDVLRFLTELACHDPQFRRDLPRPTEGGGQPVQVLADALLAFAASARSGELVERFWKTHFARLPMRQAHALPHSLDPSLFAAVDHELTLAAPAGRIELEAIGDRVCVEAGQKRWEFALRTETLLRRLLAARTVTLSALLAEKGALTADEARTLIFELAMDGLILTRAI